VRDTIAPSATILTTPSSPNRSKYASFTFSSSENDVRFECKVDSGSYSRCSSPKSYGSISNGSHTFYVRAIDQAGNVGTAASATWTEDSYHTIANYHCHGGSHRTDSSSNSIRNDLDDFNTSGASGKYGDGRRFTASSSSYMKSDHNDTQDKLRDYMTIETWIKFASLPSSGGHQVVAGKCGGSGSRGWELRLKKISTTYHLVLAVSTDGSNLTELASSPITIDTSSFHHVAVTWEKGAARFYHNGSSKGYKSTGKCGSTRIHGTTTALRIGRGESGNYLDGTIDDLRISQKVRYRSNFTPPGETDSD
jgi:hypothetical protein